MFSIRIGRRDDLEAEILREAVAAARTALAEDGQTDATAAAVAVVDAYQAALARLRQPTSPYQRIAERRTSPALATEASDAG